MYGDIKMTQAVGYGIPDLIVIPRDSNSAFIIELKVPNNISKNLETRCNQMEKSTSKECVMTHLPNELALKMDGAQAYHPYSPRLDRTDFFWNNDEVMQLLVMNIVDYRIKDTK